MVECRTPEREVRGSRPTAAVLCPWARHFTPRKYWLITQEAMALSRHDWKIVDWDVKPQHNQPTLASLLGSLLVLSAHSFARNWQLLFLNQRKRENGRRNFFMTKSPWKNVPDVGIELGAAYMPSVHASDWATAPGFRNKYSKIFFSEAIRGMKLKFCVNVHDISLYINYIFFYCCCPCALVAMASFHILIMGKVEIGIY